MTTNIITKYLIQYTQNQCYLHDIPLSPNIPSMFYWDKDNELWVSQYTNMLVVDNRKILLVPKGIVSFAKSYTPERYLQHYVLNFLQNEHLQLNTLLVERKLNGTRYVTKKKILEELPSDKKDFLRKFTIDHPEVLEEFKNDDNLQPLKNLEFSEINFGQVKKSLITRLEKLNAGKDFADEFHNLIIGILELIFYPNLLNPVKEFKRHNGRKRIDITFDNGAKDGIFYRLSNNMQIPCSYIFVECKNYSTEIANPELDQLGGRFSTNSGKVGFLVCRTIDKRDLFIERCKDTYKDGRGLIIPLTDNDIIDLLNNYNDWDYSYTEKYLSDIVREITIG